MAAGTRALAFIAALMLLAGATYAQKTSVLLVLGDGLSDQENTAIATNKTASPIAVTPNPAVYSDGSFVNEGGNWVDFIEDINATSVSVRNFAWAGSTACKYPTLVAEEPWLEYLDDLNEQAIKLLIKLENRDEPDYLQRLVSPGVRPRPLIGFIWSGLGDVLLYDSLEDSEKPQLATNVVECIRNASRALLGNPNIQNLILGTVIPVDIFPIVGTDNAGEIKPVVEAINTGITGLKAELEGEFSNSTVYIWDAYTAIQGVVANFTELNFTTLEPCVDGDENDYGLGIQGAATDTCATPDQHVLFDDLYPTSAVHNLVYQSIYSLMGDTGLLDLEGFDPILPGGGGNGTVSSLSRRLLAL